MESKPALFITFEGGEGGGKTSQIRIFKQWFEAIYGPVYQTREPGGCSIAEHIRTILLDTANTAMDHVAELLLYQAARAQHVGEVILPKLEQGISVISDRFYDSTRAYQGAARNLDLDLINQLNKIGSKGKDPDLTYLIDVSPEVGLARAGRRGLLDRLDSESMDFHQRVRQGFLDIAKENPERVVIINGESSVIEVQRAIRTEFFKRYLLNYKLNLEN